MSIQKRRAYFGAHVALGIAVAAGACVSLDRARDFHETGDCDRSFEIARKRYAQEVLYKKPGVVLGTAASAGLTGLAGAGGVVAGGATLIVLCSPFILLDAATGGSGDIAGPCIEIFDEVAGEIIKGSFTGTWEATEGMRRANYDHISSSLRESVHCYLERPESEDLTKARVAYLFLMNENFQANLSYEERDAVRKLGRENPQLTGALPGEGKPD